MQQWGLASEKMIRTTFRIIGGYVLFYAIGVFCVGEFSPRFSVQASLKHKLLLAALAAVLATIGIGLLYLRKWAALGLSGLALYPFYWCIWAVFHRTGDAADWLGLVFGALLITPSILTVKYWHLLLWRSESSAKS